MGDCEDNGSHRELGSIISHPHLLLSEYPDKSNLKEKEFSCGGEVMALGASSLVTLHLQQEMKGPRHHCLARFQLFYSLRNPTYGIVPPRV